MPNEWVTGIVILIHKSKDQKDLNNYMPVTLLTSIYKIRATVIANRMGPIMNLLTSETQCGYKINKSSAEIISHVNKIY